MSSFWSFRTFLIATFCLFMGIFGVVVFKALTRSSGNAHVDAIEIQQIRAKRLNP